jgi:hypothetical protein
LGSELNVLLTSTYGTLFVKLYLLFNAFL